MKLRIALFSLLALLVSVGVEPPVHGTGTALLSVTSAGTGMTRYTVMWTSTAGGAVSDNGLHFGRGFLKQAEIIPDQGAAQPTALYDVTFVDTHSVDWFQDAGLNQSNSASTLILFSPPIYFDGLSNLDLVVVNAGASKQGTVVLYFADQSVGQ